ncbi:TMEM175 family protein [Methylosinus sp. Sm6]|uniref:TMEM175 family protein n=1 Tax=Methylosinus sp. Sm6 TaxID=2866948 RepID=UPI001C98E561|nr:TMEM175 family protein [Methylosinus sp. Sm6]MBY6241435.1 DUF1211 domain-containing protein [Methylosinus sp. Sm6]
MQDQCAVSAAENGCKCRTTKLAAARPGYLAVFISFVTILAIWAHHHWIFTTIRRADHPLVYWNGSLLIVVTLVPFSAGLLAEYLLHPEARIAANIYTGNFLAIALAFHGLWRHISKSGAACRSKAAGLWRRSLEPTLSCALRALGPGVAFRRKAQYRID